MLLDRMNTKSKKKYPELKVLWIGVFIDILGFFIILPYLPMFMIIYNTDPFMIGLLMATNAVFTFISAPIWGKASDHFGRKPMLIICQFGTMTAFLMLAFSDSLEMIFLSRMVDGIFGGNFTLVKSILSDIVPPKDRGLQMTNAGVVIIFAGLIGPGLGGILSIYGILGPGLAAAAMSFTTVCVTIFYLKESWPKEKRIKSGKQHGVKIKLRKNKNAMYMLTLWWFHTFTFMMFFITLALIIYLVLGLSVFEAGILFTIGGIFRAIIRFTLFKRMLKVLGEKRMIKIGLGLFIITFMFIGFITDVVTYLIFTLLFSFAASCSRGPLIAKITLSVSPREMGKINGWSSALDSLGQIFGPLVVGLIFGLYGHFWLGLLIGLLSIIAFIMNFKKIEMFDFTNMKSDLSKLEKK